MYILPFTVRSLAIDTLPFNEASAAKNNLPPMDTSEPTYKRALNEASPNVNNLPPMDTSDPTYRRALCDVSPTVNNLPPNDKSPVLKKPTPKRYI